MNQNTRNHLDRLIQFLGIPSVSTLSEYAQDMQVAATFLKRELEEIGFKEVEQLQNSQEGHPTVFAQRVDNPLNPTILIYGHYDVQPPDPVEQWKSPPFKPEIRDGNVYARGATDDKGQLYTHIAALRECAAEWGNPWPVNVKMLIEGEEEAGGETISTLIREHATDDLFAADVCLVSDTGFVTAGLPALEYGLRGIAYMQIDVKLADADLHSGLFGGGVMNPALALAQILASLKDSATGKIAIPGIYDDVVMLRDDERRDLASVARPDEEMLKTAANAKAVYGEEGYTTQERTTARPSLDVNGMWGGFMGDGAKTIIPAEAHAKVSIRTVGNQEPEHVAKLFEEYVLSIAPKEVDVSVQKIHCGDGVLVSTDSPCMCIAADALEEVFGVRPVFTRSGGSIPVIALIKKYLGIDPILIGYGLPDDGLHGPNEKFSLEQFEKGIVCNKLLYNRIALSKKTDN